MEINNKMFENCSSNNTYNIIIIYMYNIQYNTINNIKFLREY